MTAHVMDTNYMTTPAVLKRTPKFYNGLTEPRAVPGLTQAASMFQSHKSRMASATQSSSPREEETAIKRTASASHAPISSIPDVPDELPKTYKESQGPTKTTSTVWAYFSTSGNKFPPRRLPEQTPPVVARSDPQKDTHIMIKDLRDRFPHVCNSIFAHSTEGHPQWDITWFFDEWDFHVHGGQFLYNVILTMQHQNEKAVMRVVEDWGHRNEANYPWFPNQNLGIEEIFAQQDRDRFGPEFCGVCLRTIRNAFGTAYLNFYWSGWDAPSRFEPGYHFVPIASKQLQSLLPSLETVAEDHERSNAPYSDPQNLVQDPKSRRGSREATSPARYQRPGQIPDQMLHNSHGPQHFSPSGMVSQTPMHGCQQPFQYVVLPQKFGSAPPPLANLILPPYGAQVSEVAFLSNTGFENPHSHFSNAQHSEQKKCDFSDRTDSGRSASESFPKRGGKKTRGKGGRQSFSNGTQLSRSNTQLNNNADERSDKLNRSNNKKQGTHPATRFETHHNTERPPPTSLSPTKHAHLTRRRSPEEQYAHVSPHARKTMVRQRFIGEDVEDVRELQVNGVQTNLSDRDIRDAIGPFAAAQQIRIHPTTRSATIEFFSTADARTVLAQSPIPCKGGLLRVQVPPRYIRAGSESPDCEPPAYNLRRDQNKARPRNGSGFAQDSQTSRGHRDSSDVNRRNSFSDKSPSNAIRSIPSNPVYSPQDVRSSLVPSINEEIVPPSKTWATIAAGSGNALMNQPTRVQVHNEQLNRYFVTKAGDQEQAVATGKWAQDPDSQIEKFPPIVDETTADMHNGGKSHTLHKEKSKDTSNSKPARIDSAVVFTNDQKIRAYCVEQSRICNTANEAAKQIETLPLDDTCDDRNLLKTLSQSVTANPSSLKLEKELFTDESAPKLLVAENNMIKVDDSLPDVSSIDQVKTAADTELKEVASSVSPETTRIDQSNMDELSNGDGESSVKDQQINVGAMQAATPSRTQLTEGSTAIPPGIFSRKRSNTGSSSSTEAGSPPKSSKSASRKLAKAILDAREEDSSSTTKQNIGRKGKPSQPNKRKTSPSPPPDVHQKSSPNGSRNHSPSASRELSYKSSPSSQDLGPWRPDYEKAQAMNAKIVDNSLKERWSRELTAFGTQLESIDDRHAQHLEKCETTLSKSVRKSSRKMLNQLARSQKEKLEELVLLRGRISRQVEFEAVNATKAADAHRYPAFHQPTAQEKFTLSSGSTEASILKSSPFSAIHQRESVMTPQQIGETMPSIDSVMIDKDDFRNIDDMKLKRSFSACGYEPTKSKGTAEATAIATPTVADDEFDNETALPLENPKTKQAAPKPKSYASVAASGIRPAQIGKTLSQSPVPSKPILGSASSKPLVTKADRQGDLGEWEAPEGPWGVSGLSFKNS